MDEFKKYLDEEIEKAAKNFEEARLKAIRELQTMTVFDAVNYGAGYFTHIDNLTRYATEIQALATAHRVFNFMEKKQEEKAE